MTNSKAGHAPTQKATEITMTAVVDLNGVLRGKRLTGADVSKALDDGIHMPLSIVGVDIWGTDIANSAQVFNTGDADGHFVASGRGPLMQSWFPQPTTLHPFTMVDETGQATGVCPRGALSRIIKRYAQAGLTIVAATELEFHLIKRNEESISPHGDGRLGTAAAIECIDALQAKEAFFSEVYDIAEAWGIALGAAMSEAGPGQYEVNLNHDADALKIADDTYFFKRIVKGVAAKHGLEATFMAKPFGGDAGNGLHVHFSILDQNGHNIFDNGGDEGSPALHHALGGVEASMADFMLFFAPHANSYRRFVKDSFAPTKVAWGYDNRLSALRVPKSAPVARRIEHRVAGADANPYLVLAAILGAALIGIQEQIKPSAPVKGNAYEADRTKLPVQWAQAVERFAESAWPARLFDARLIRMMKAVKEQELQIFAARIPRFEYDTYVDVV